jgi:hypothetical protein
MEESDSDIDTTDRGDTSFSDSAEAFTMNNEKLSADARRKIRVDVSELQTAVWESTCDDNPF